MTSTSRSYRMTADSGHAPCVFDTFADMLRTTDANCAKKGSKVLSLATCARGVRRGTSEGDYVLGIACNDFGEKANHLIWAGKISRIISKGEYFREFNGRPDNYYEELSKGNYLQLFNPFHNSANLDSDLNPPNVLLFENEWWYFGKNLQEIVPQHLLAERQEAKILNEISVKKFIRTIAEKYPRRILLGKPSHLDLADRKNCL